MGSELRRTLSDLMQERSSTLRRSELLRKRRLQLLSSDESIHQILSFMEKWIEEDKEERGDSSTNDEFARVYSRIDLEHLRRPEENEFEKRLRLFYVLEESRTIGTQGEPSMFIKFSTMYLQLNPKFKFRLFKITGRPEIAMDLMKDGFMRLEDDSKIDMLYSCSIEKKAVAKRIMEIFDDLSSKVKGAFIQTTSIPILEAILQSSAQLSLLTATELMIAANRLAMTDLGRSIKLDIQKRIWSRKDELKRLSDLALLVQLSKSLGGQLLPEIVDEMCRISSKPLGSISSSSHGIQIFPRLVNAAETYRTELSQEDIQDMVQIDRQFSVLLLQQIPREKCGKIYINSKSLFPSPDSEKSVFMGTISNEWPCVCVHWPEEMDLPALSDRTEYSLTISLEIEDEIDEDTSEPLLKRLKT